MPKAMIASLYIMMYTYKAVQWVYGVHSIPIFDTCVYIKITLTSWVHNHLPGNP